MVASSTTTTSYSFDRLTGLGNAAFAIDVLERWRDEGAQNDRAVPIHAILIGLGRFDTVNLAYGEAAGDGALAEVARRIRLLAEDELAHGDWIAARIGGGQFLLAAREACSRERWQWLSEALTDALSAPIALIGGVGAVRLWPRAAMIRMLSGERTEHVLDRLAATLGKANDKTGARVLWASEVYAPPGYRSAQLEADLIAALDRDEIEVVIQPQYDLAGCLLVGGEALARWQHPTLGLIGATAMFAIAERAEHVAHLSRHIAQRALALAARWGSDLRLSLNVTPDDLSNSGFVREFLAMVADSGFPAERLTLEITEHVLLNNLEEAAQKLSQLRDTGMRIALDDFGSGFCNFGYLKLLPLDYLKLDKSMIEGVTDDPRDLAVLRAIVALADALGLKVVVEGVETEEQRALALAEGCLLFQGFLCSPALSATEFLRLVGKHAANR
jgi:predicted signal transduction protein with EAL and GGDEF domain